ncbi:hypothetical protein E2C01_034266 [Portunus trituberculatus]|uniref:Uncharacterized protein n=1 Tax=Portunus trituberculatus TaxID=210409 RepID=A0A5B7F100_PORTR|nr:hypothetical protein [Portunus trituberculatus]
MGALTPAARKAGFRCPSWGVSPVPSGSARRLGGRTIVSWHLYPGGAGYCGRERCTVEVEGCSEAGCMEFRLCRLCLFHPHELNHDVDYEGLMYGSRRVSVEEYMFYGGMVRVAWARESGDGGG